MSRLRSKSEPKSASTTLRSGGRLSGLGASFFDAPQGVAPFTINAKLDQVLADVSAGLDVINTAGAVMRIRYDGRFAQDTQQNSVSLKGSVPF